MMVAVWLTLIRFSAAMTTVQIVMTMTHVSIEMSPYVIATTLIAIGMYRLAITLTLGMLQFAIVMTLVSMKTSQFAVATMSVNVTLERETMADKIALL